MTTPSNNGLISLNKFQRARPVCVSGAGRSGTTALARVVDAMGVPSFFGDAGNAEEEGISPLCHGMHEEGLRDEFAEKTAGRRGVWLLKVPGLSVHAANHAAVRRALNCNWLIVLRDPVAISDRLLSLHGDDERPADFTIVNTALENNYVIASAIELARHHGVMLVSYEKLLVKPDPIIEEIAYQLGLREYDMEAVKSVLIPEEPRYIESQTA